jgi:hypothetical protein
MHARQIQIFWKKYSL